MSYTVKIMDNDSGNVVVDEANALCIVGAVGREGGVHQLAAACGTTYVICRTLNSAENAIKSVDRNHEELKIKRQTLRLLGMMADMCEDDTDS